MADKSKMFMFSPAMPKGDACALHLTKEYKEGYWYARTGGPNDNPYDFWDSYNENYAWVIGWQKGKSIRDANIQSIGIQSKEAVDRNS